MKIWVFAPIQAIVAGVEVWFPLASRECAREGEVGMTNSTKAKTLIKLDVGHVMLLLQCHPPSLGWLLHVQRNRNQTLEHASRSQAWGAEAVSSGAWR